MKYALKLLKLKKAWDTYNASPAYRAWRKGIQACPKGHHLLLERLDRLREQSEAAAEITDAAASKIRDAMEKWIGARDACRHCSKVQSVLIASTDYKAFRKTKRKLERRLGVSGISVLQIERS